MEKTTNNVKTVTGQATRDGVVRKNFEEMKQPEWGQLRMVVRGETISIGSREPKMVEEIRNTRKGDIVRVTGVPRTRKDEGRNILKVLNDVTAFEYLGSREVSSAVEWGTW